MAGDPELRRPLTLLGASFAVFVLFVLFVLFVGAAVWLYEYDTAAHQASGIPPGMLTLQQKTEALQQVSTSGASTTDASAASSTPVQDGVPTPAQQQALDSVSQNPSSSNADETQRMQTLQSLNSH